MRDDDAMKKENGGVPGAKQEGIDRREFFITAGKVIIPTLGLLGLSLTGLPQKVQAAVCPDCSNNCKDSCLTGCGGSCGTGCGGGCTGTCKGACEGTAK